MSEDKVSGTIPGIGSFSAEGGNIVKLMLIVMGFAFLGYMVYQLNTELKAMNTQAAHEHKQLAEGVSEMVFVISLSPEERKRLGIAMPRSLRDKIRESRP